MLAVQNSENTSNSKSLNAITDFNVMENEEGNVVFSTIDNEAKGWVHKNYMKADLTEESNEGSSLDNQYFNNVRNQR